MTKNRNKSDYFYSSQKMKKSNFNNDNKIKNDDYAKNLKLSEDINPIQLLKEEELLISQIRMALSYDDTEYEITFISDFFNYFEK